MSNPVSALAAVFLTASLAGPALAAPLTVPFDFSHSELELTISVKGKPFHAILDTGVDPSLVDLADARALGLRIDQDSSGEASGFGDGRGATVTSTEITDLSIGGREFQRFTALASDMSSLSKAGQPRLSVVLGYSFLSDKIVLIDYLADRLSILDTQAQAHAMVGGCKARWRTKLKTLNSYPVIPAFRLGNASGPATLDTGSTGNIGLFRSALKLPGLPMALVKAGSMVRRGARGASTVETFRLKAPVGFGPFTLPAEQTVFMHKDDDSQTTRVANIGNALLDQLKVKVLLDYRSRVMAVYGRCN